MRDGAAAVIIGNEVLTAKVQDQNGPLLIRRLRERGMPLHRMEVVTDDVDAIVDAVVRARQVAKHVFTSGGIGPTHDDVTVRSVALALGRRVVRLDSMAKRVREYYGDATTPEALRLADAPEGAELWTQKGIWYPVLSCDGVYMLPGVPQLFKLQLETVLERIEMRPIFVRCIFLSAREHEIAHAIDQVALAMPDVAIGSYPNFDPAIDYTVKLTVENVEREPMERAFQALIAALPKEKLLRVE